MPDQTRSSATDEVSQRRSRRDATLHARILAELEARITSGAWPPGHRLPFEVELAKSYACSRMTVNKVLAQLVDAGLIERRKRAGTFVRHPRVQSAVLEIHDIAAEVASLGQRYAFRLLRRAVRSTGPAIRAWLGDVAESADVLDLTALHLADEMPFCLEERLINFATVPDAADAHFETLSPGTWLLAQVPWTSAEHRIQAVAAEPAAARHLQVPAGSACLVVERRTWNDEGAVTAVRLTYPGPRHALVATFAPGR